MKPILEYVQQNPLIQSYVDGIEGIGNLSLYEEALLHVIRFQAKQEPLLVVKSNAYQAQKLYQAVISLLAQDEVYLYLVEESMRVEYIAASPEAMADQIETIASIRTQSHVLVITHTAALIKRLPNPATFAHYYLNLRIDEEERLDTLKAKLLQAGYQAVQRIDQPLCFASRGGIIDVYSMNYEYPIRIEFFDTVIDSIRFFDISTQRTIRTVDEVTIIPATLDLFTPTEVAIVQDHIAKQREKIHDIERAEALDERLQQDIDALDQHITNHNLNKYYRYLPQEFSIADYMQHPFIALSSKEEVIAANQRINEENISFMQELVSENLSLPIYSLFNDFQALRLRHTCYEIMQFGSLTASQSSGIVELSVEDGNLAAVLKTIIEQAKTQCVALLLKDHEIIQVKEALDLEAVSYREEPEHLSVGISLYHREILQGFACLNDNLIVYSSKELFKRKIKLGRYHNKFKEADVIHSYLELERGDYVVHNQHGVGKYLGIITRALDGIHKDYLQIAYKGEDVLFVPLEQFKLIRKFVSKEGVAVKLNKLGSGDWEKTKARIKENVAELANRLVKLYALREEKVGFAYALDDALQAEFEADFPYELTPDQAQAVREIKQDMESNQVMDRLLCGDVGFGKTEVALRAIFKAVTNQKQVAYLCPTTILSSQHYKTFIKRLANYPVNVAILNRFTTPNQQREILQQLKEGTIDILIGTHRILSKDVAFQDLGLLVIDEEQRFGVEHKEKIKELKHTIDVLSLSATPIPRTLQMSLIGIRSLSQLNTPPQNRVPVQTFVIERNYDLAKEIIERELSRDGQVFYLHNNVKTIYEVANKLAKKLPGVKIGVAHGKMHKEEIEDVMLAFVENEYQILVCTTIIETGIDISNANTIVIDDADRFGLSQLYQIKGRVGRSDRLAYAYLMYAPQKQLTEIAQKRLKAIKEFTQLGSGYKIAMRDLTIRGAGDLLGPHQAGFIDTIGIDMYLEMLHTAIREEKGEVVEVAVEPKRSNVKLDAYIPEQFSTADGEKVAIYQQIEQINSKMALRNLMEELEDNYGRLPKQVALLFEKKRLDLMINEPHLDVFKETDKTVELVFSKAFSSKVDGMRLFELTTKLSRDIKVGYTNQVIHMKWNKTKGWMDLLLQLLEETLQLVEGDIDEIR
ncbi:MAG: transcription-repair coupling factor [Erysipelotrichaceae bacterium]